MRTPLAGQYVVAKRAGPGWDLYTLEEWGAFNPPRIHLDKDGRILFNGRTTGYDSNILLDTGNSLDPLE